MKCVQSLNLLINSDTSVPQNVVGVLKLGFKSNWLPLISECLALLSLLSRLKRNVLHGEEQEIINLLIYLYENLQEENSNDWIIKKKKLIFKSIIIRIKIYLIYFILDLKETMEITIWYLIQDPAAQNSLLKTSVDQKNYTVKIKIKKIIFFKN